MGEGTSGVFVVGTGRSGTRALFKALRHRPELEIHHEFVCTHIQPLAAKYFMGRAAHAEVAEALRSLHGAAMFWSLSDVWADCSNKLTWIIDVLAAEFTDARFVNIVRDGRKVALSYYKKLGDEMYDDASVEVLQQWLADPRLPEPPPEKKYWWNVPQEGQPWHEEFPGFDHFQRAAYHWVQANRTARDLLAEHVRPERQLTLRLEDLVGDVATQERLCAFMQIGFDETVTRSLARPENVIVPVDYVLSDTQRRQFAELAAGEMDVLGYSMDDPEYRVAY